MLRGRLICCSACSIAVVASPRETPGAKLNDRFTTGNWPRRLIASGALRISMRVKAESGTCVVLADAAAAVLLVEVLPVDVLLADAVVLEVLVAVVPALVTPLVDLT